MIQVHSSDQTELIVDVTGYYVSAPDPDGLVFYPIPPCRVVDTREVSSTSSDYYDPPIETGLGFPILATATERTFKIGGTSRCGTVPKNAGAYALNLTVVPRLVAGVPQALGFLTVWPADTSQPTISNLNNLQAQVIANAAIVRNPYSPYGPQGELKVFASDSAHLIIDITGYYAKPRTTNDGMYFNTLTPCRVANQIPLAANFEVTVGVIGVGGCGVPATADAYAANVTVTPSGPLGFLAAFPAGTLKPVVSLINALNGAPIANSELVLAGRSEGSSPIDGALSVYATDPGSVSVDVSGYFTLPTSAQAKTLVEVNLGGVPIDRYLEVNGSGGEHLPACSPSLTVANCYQQFFLGPGGYIGQGVKGARFQFGVVGGYGSRVWDSAGNVRPQWVERLQNFLNALKSYGVERVTPTPALYGFGDDLFTPDSAAVLGLNHPSVKQSCDGSHKLNFHPWLPFGLFHENPPDPITGNPDDRAGEEDCRFINNGHFQAARSPHFWGWDPYEAMWSAIFQAIRIAGLEVGDVDMSNEIHLQLITVQARLIYDCPGGVPGAASCTDVLGRVRRAAARESVDSWSVTFSTPATQPAANSFGYCNSFYGDSALILTASALANALDGKIFGQPSNRVVGPDGLECIGTAGTMTPLGKRYDLPRVVDTHIYPCIKNPNVCGPQDATVVATQYYNALRGLMKARGYRSARAVIGETHSNQNCENYTTAQANQSFSGYKLSSLFSDRGGQTILRPWVPASGPCIANTTITYQVPGPLNPPYVFP